MCTQASGSCFSLHKARGAWQEGERPDSRWCACVLYCAAGMPPLKAGSGGLGRLLKVREKKKVGSGGMCKFYFTVCLRLHP